MRLTGSDSYVNLPAMPKLDGSDEMSLTVWVYWEGTGQYPNILTWRGLEPGGISHLRPRPQLLVSHGPAGAPPRCCRRGLDGSLRSVPLRVAPKQWVHLAAVFKRPQITTYVNGKKVGSARWDYPVGLNGDLEVGRWSGSTSHAGLIDELRIYRRAPGGRRGAGLGQSGGPPNGRLQRPGPCQDRGQGTRPL